MSNVKAYRVDGSMTSAMDAFIMYGHDPGSCTSLLIKGDYEAAMQHAHPLIRPPINGEDDIYRSEQDRTEKIGRAHV